MHINCLFPSNSSRIIKGEINTPCTRVLKVSALALMILVTCVGVIVAAAGAARLVGFHLPGFLAHIDPFYLYFMIPAGVLTALAGGFGIKKVGSTRESPVESNQPTLNQTKHVERQKKVKAQPKSGSKKTPPPPMQPPKFAEIQSGSLVKKSLKIKGRSDFMASKRWQTDPPKIAKSSWIPDNLVTHLMVNKKDTAIAVKYQPGDAITNMEGVAHTLITSICKTHMLGDPVWKGGHSIALFGRGLMRQVVLSTSIQPDFETEEVMLQFAALGEHPVEGEHLDEINIPTPEEKKNVQSRQKYDQQLRKHMIYHLMSDHRLPAKKEVQTIHELDSVLDLLAQQAQNPEFSIQDLKNLYVKVTIPGNKFEILPLELLANLYIEQLSSELITLNSVLPQGFVYTINPPSIFVTAIGRDARLLNRLQLLAIKQIVKEHPLPNLEHIAFSDYADPACLKLYRSAFQQSKITVSSKTNLFGGPEETYDPPEHLKKCVLVIHNNSDGFGQNIENEETGGSLDGVIGSYSDAACVLKRKRPDLVSDIVTVN